MKPTPPSFITAVRPGAGRLAIVVSEPEHVLPLLSTWRPAARLHRDRIELRHLDRNGRLRATVMLEGIDKPLGRDLLRQLASHTAKEMPPRSRTRWSDDLLSGLLRRFLLWRTATAIQVRPMDQAVRLDWRGGPTADTVAAVLRSPSCGLPGANSQVKRSDLDHCVVIAAADRAALRTEPWPAWAELDRLRRSGSGHRPVAPRFPRELWDTLAWRNAVARRDLTAATGIRLTRQHVLERNASPTEILLKPHRLESIDRGLREATARALHLYHYGDDRRSGEEAG